MTTKEQELADELLEDINRTNNYVEKYNAIVRYKTFAEAMKARYEAGEVEEDKS